MNARSHRRRVLEPEQDLSRGEQTRLQLMRAAETLFAKQGIADVTVRAIVAAAGQKNESALHYHFGGRDGLIAALHEERNGQIRAERAAVFEALNQPRHSIDLRGIVVIMVEPAYRLAARDPGFRNYLKVFAHLMLFSGKRVSDLEARGQKKGNAGILDRLSKALPDLPEALLEIRLEQAARFATLSLSQHARESRPFRGRRAELFFSNLVDTIAGMFEALPSPVTLELLN